MILSLRESVVKDILDVIDDVKSVADIGLGSGHTGLSMSSISRASKDLVMSFPVLCDNSIDPKTASMICKAVERKAVSMLQLIFAANSFHSDKGCGVDFIKQWHGNIDGGSLSLDDYINLCDKLSETATFSTAQQREINEAVSLIKEENKRGCNSYPVSSFSEHSINDFKVHTRFGDTVVTEAPVLNLTNRNSREAYAAIDNIQKNEVEYFTKQLLDSDVKKCNELVPSLMIIRFTSGSKENPVFNQMVAGVKARLIPVDSYDIIDRVNSKNKDKAGLVNLIRATTKEISFVKDYLLAINRAKIDAKNNSIRSNSARIWKTLEKRATKSVWKRLIGRTNNAACITTLVVSQQVVNVLKKEYGVNLADIRTANMIMDSYNLLCICIVDESIEVARFLYDGDDWYEDISFNALERESGDGSYKKVINLLSKMNRG